MAFRSDSEYRRHVQSVDFDLDSFTKSTTKTDSFKCTPVVDCRTDPTLPECQTAPPTNADITGVKFCDANTDGLQDNGELGIANWLIQINPTDVNGATFQLAGDLPPTLHTT
jgi:hypothetical protein